VNLEQFFQLLRPTQQHAREQERKLREAIESWEQRAFSINAAIGLLRAALHLQQQHEDLLLQQRQTLSLAPSDNPQTTLASALIEQARHHQHLHTYTLRAVYRQLLEQKKQLLQQGQEHFLPVIQSLPDERKERITRLFQQSQEDIQQVSVARQEVAALRELEEQRQRPLTAPISPHTTPIPRLHATSATNATSASSETTATSEAAATSAPTETSTSTALPIPTSEMPETLASLEQRIHTLLQILSIPPTTIDPPLPTEDKIEGVTG
jgi:hypothetical protein